MPYNFQGAGGIINTGPIEGIYYLDPVTFLDSLVPNNDADAATKFYVDQHILDVLDSETMHPNLAEAVAVAGRINLSTMQEVDGDGNVTRTNIIMTVAENSITTTQLAEMAVETDNVADGNISLIKLNTDVTVNALLTQSPPNASLNFNTQQLKDLADPTDTQDATTMSYVDAADTALDTRIAAIEAAYVQSFAYDTDSDTLTLTDQDGASTVVDLGSAVSVNSTEVDEPNFVDGEFISFEVSGSDVSPVLDTDTIATREYVDSEIVQHLIDSVGVLGGNGIETFINANDTEVIVVDADTEFFQFNDDSELTLVPGSITGDADPNGLIASSTIRGSNIADNSILGSNLNANIAGCLLYTSPSPRDRTRSRMPSSA